MAKMPKQKGKQPKNSNKNAPKRRQLVVKQIAGKGGFMDFIKSIVPAGSAEKLGGLVGGPLGGKLGGLFSKVTGIGDYQHNNDDLEHNSLFNKGDSLQAPQMHNNKHVTRIVRREYLGDVIAGATGANFNLVSYDVNPGLQQCFPWLSQIAQNYESYKFLGLAFEYKSTSGESVASNNTSLGTVVLCAEYNATNANFINKMDMENYEGSVSIKPSSCVLFGVECRPSDNALGDHLYIRATGVPAGQDQKTYDMCNFQIATVGIPANSTNLGELWVSYDVELYAPKLFGSQLGYGIEYAHLQSNAGGVSTSNYFGNGYSNSLTTNSNFTPVFSATTITFPANIVTGVYYIEYIWVQGAGTSVGPTIAATTNCSGLYLWNKNTSYQYSSPSVSTTSGMAGAWITVTGPSAVITFSGGTIGTTTSMDLFLYQLNGLAN
jgi:hypothetical protein